MADCDLCGVSIPTVCPVKVFEPQFEHSYPEGIWKGLCEKCLDSAKGTFDEKRDEEGKCVPGNKFDKCDLCGTTCQLYNIDVFVPSFKNVYDEEVRHLCRRCLESCNEAYDRKDECFGEHH
ncbi:MAG: F420H2 dehydrogenase subunit FpoO [Methanohalophilus sp.]